MTIVFAGGGTGGHLFPGIAVAEELLRRERSVRILFAGSERDVEREIVARHGHEHVPLPVVSSRAWYRNPLRFAWSNWAALRGARKLLAREHPAVVIGLGGFASVPVVWAASSLRIPVVLLEQNLVPGRATRWLGRRADLVCASYAETASRLGNSPKVRVTGNPVRGAIAELCTAHPRAEQHAASGGARGPMLLVLGGSQGSTAVNAAVLSAVEALREALSGWHVVHQTGKDQADATRQRYAQLSIVAHQPIVATVEPFLDAMTDLYRRATVVVSRAGATTLAELACAGCPSLLIPFPRAIGDHQTANARAFEAAGAARVVAQQRDAVLTATDLAAKLQPLLADQTVRDTMRRGMQSLARPNAARDVVDAILSLTRQEHTTCR